MITTTRASNITLHFAFFQLPYCIMRWPFSVTTLCPTFCTVFKGRQNHDSSLSCCVPNAHKAALLEKIQHLVWQHFVR